MNNWFYYILLLLSLACSSAFAITILCFLIKSILKPMLVRKNTTAIHHTLRRKLLIDSLVLLGSVWTLRFAVNLYLKDNFGWFEEIFNSFVHALQTFSLDEDYVKYIVDGKRMIYELFDGNSFLINFYGVYAAVLNALVPVIGGAFIFEIISEISPKIRLNLSFFLKKYYFSELNDNSLALAKSIIKLKRRACIVFTDVYVNSGEEAASERLLSAKSIGAICLKDDITHIKVKGYSPKIFLIDKSEIGNLKALTNLLEHSKNSINRSEIYIFSSDELYSKLDENVAIITNQKFKEKKRRSGKRPVVIPVNGIRNMASNLFLRMPLYEPLISKKTDENGRKKLTVTILGSSVIGTEFFLTTYWCGQMLDCDLSINVISKEKKNDFEGKINYINKDILETVKKNQKSEGINQSFEPYFDYKYEEYDILSRDFINLLNPSYLLDTDYFIVALGSDEKNLDVANVLRHRVGAYHLLKEAAGKKTVISYVVYNSDLCVALNKSQMCNYSPDNEENDICMYAFGDLNSLYGYENILLDGISECDDERTLNSFELRKKIKKAEKNIKAKESYSYQSDIARKIHRKYKMYSAGFIKSGIFEINGKNVDSKDKTSGSKNEFVKFIVEEKNSKEKEQMLNRLAWLEHRRWCAYMRTKGFVAPSEFEYDRYFAMNNKDHNKYDHKYIHLKLHPCIVECSCNGINALFDDRGFLIAETECKTCDYPRSKDFLDALSYDKVKRLKGNEEKIGQHKDFKHWDYPQFDIDDEDISLIKVKRCGRFSIDKNIDQKSLVYKKEDKYYISTKYFIETINKNKKLLKYKKMYGPTIFEKIDFYKYVDDEKIAKEKLFYDSSLGINIDKEMGMIEYEKINEYSKRLIKKVAKDLREAKKYSRLES